MMLPWPGVYRVGLLITLLLLKAAAHGQTFTVDFSHRTGPPLVKTRFGVYQTPLTTLPDLLRSLPHLDEIPVQDFRYEMGWGKPEALGYDQISGTAADPRIDFSVIDALANALAEHRVKPLFALSYCPNPLKTRTEWAGWKDMPRDLPAWQKIVTAYVGHLRSIMGKAAAYEVWNEPDMPEPGGKMFFAGTPDDYGTLYAATVPAVRAGDGDALVGGGAFAYDLRYFAPLVSQPLDFASIHAYDNYAGQLANLRGGLANRPEVPLFLTEYASFTDMPANGPQSRAAGAMRFFRDARAMLAIPDLAKVYWAQWVDAGHSPGIGLLTWDGHRKAIFNAFKIYGRMPVDRCAVTPTDSANGVGVMASVDDRAAGVVLWNESASPRAVTVDLQRLPFARTVLETYRIDSAHASYVDDAASEDLHASETRQLPNAAGARWTGDMPAESVVYIEAHDARNVSNAGGPGANAAGNVGDYVRTCCRFADRAPGAPFADFDPRTGIARLGMGDRDRGSAEVGVVLDRPTRWFGVHVQKWGAWNVTHSTLRIDFAVSGRDGGYGKSVLLSGGSLLTAKPFTVDLARLAPPDWDRKRVRLTFTLRDAGSGAQANFQLTPEMPLTPPAPSPRCRLGSKWGEGEKRTVWHPSALEAGPIAPDSPSPQAQRGEGHPEGTRG